MEARELEILKGHLLNMRSLGQMCFMEIRTSRNIEYAIVEEPSLVKVLQKLHLESVVMLKGRWQIHQGRREMLVAEAEIIAEAQAPPPVELAKSKVMAGLNVNTLLSMRPLTLRSPLVRSIFTVQEAITLAFAEYARSEGCRQIISPKLVASGTEGGAQLFHVDYFGRKAYLAQSPQFYKQMMVGVFERVFEIGAVYRAEEHDTARHINEFVSLDVELGFVTEIEQLMAFEQGLIRHIFARVAELCPEALALHGVKLPEPKEICFARIEFNEALQLLASLGIQMPKGEPDLNGEGERALCKYFAQKEGKQFVFVTAYPQRVRPFYAMPLQESGTNEILTHSFDLLYEGLEITTGGLRIHEVQKLEQAIQSRGMPLATFSDYLMAFKHGMPPHGGFAIGLERLTAQILRLPSVKQASLFPRDINRLSP
ncbi:MAG: aspartate--tRNA(Asn) ligase [Candidatus Melainabacteria bacterium]|jgi:nondiscriminating aspartyl-tRNA synthetase|nr:aspartate--tRNA(Asn) ligase [Candidatus Melainabacteria bacterium]MBX9673411.1 aspartate--tRNA(Asn) ligase [Candidatus Obscuribacterales bacterium]